MEKPLSEMTLEELWALFPIRLCPPDPRWPEWYREEARRLAACLNLPGLRMHHIGSTAIPGIWAKPIIDILLEAPGEIPFAPLGEKLLQSGYLCMTEELGRLSFNRGYTSRGFAERVFHLHLRRRGDNRELYFRDYLREHRPLAEEYERRKRALAGPFRHDRDGYTREKGPFVEQWTAAALAAYPHRYD